MAPDLSTSPGSKDPSRLRPPERGPGLGLGQVPLSRGGSCVPGQASRSLPPPVPPGEPQLGSSPGQTPSLLDTRLPPSPQRVSLLCSEGSGPGPRRPARLLRDTLVPICRFRLQRPGSVLPRAPRLRPLRALSPQHAHAHTQPARQPAWPGASTLGSRRMTGRQGGLGTLLPPSCLPQTSHELLRRAHL